MMTDSAGVTLGGDPIRPLIEMTLRPLIPTIPSFSMFLPTNVNWLGNLQPYIRSHKGRPLQWQKPNYYACTCSAWSFINLKTAHACPGHILIHLQYL